MVTLRLTILQITVMQGFRAVGREGGEGFTPLIISPCTMCTSSYCKRMSKIYYYRKAREEKTSFQVISSVTHTNQSFEVSKYVQSCSWRIWAGGLRTRSLAILEANPPPTSQKLSMPLLRLGHSHGGSRVLFGNCSMCSHHVHKVPALNWKWLCICVELDTFRSVRCCHHCSYPSIDHTWINTQYLWPSVWVPRVTSYCTHPWTFPGWVGTLLPYRQLRRLIVTWKLMDMFVYAWCPEIRFNL